MRSLDGEEKAKRRRSTVVAKAPSEPEIGHGLGSTK